MAYNDIVIPKFKTKQNQLYGGLLQKQLGFVQGAEQGLDPYSMAQGFRTNAMSSLADDTFGAQLSEETGDTGAGAAYDLSQKNNVTEQYNQLLTFFNSPEGRAQIARAKAGLYGPETLTALQGLDMGPKGPPGPGIFGGLVQAGAAAGGMGWSPFG